MSFGKCDLAACFASLLYWATSIKAKAKARAAKLAEGQDLTTDSDWDLDEYIGEQKEKKVKSKD